MVGYTMLVFNGLLSLAAIGGLQVPWIFSSPSIFAFMSFLLLVCGIWLIETEGELTLKAKFFMCCYLFGVLLFFPITFGFLYEAPSSFLSFGFYRMVLLMLGIFALQAGFRVFLRTEIPIALLAVIVPALMLLLHWFFVPDTPLEEMKLLGRVLFIGSVFGGLYAWLWVKAVKTTM